MRSRLTHTIAPALLCAVAALSQDAKDAEYFEKQVRPILVQRCYACHSSTSQPVMGQLRLDSRAGALKGGARGPAVAPGAPEKSLLVTAVRHADKALRMPPGGRLSDAEVAHLVEWVRMGAPWGVETAAAAASAPPAFWAFQSPKEPAVPEVRDREWVKSPIDRFLLAALEAKGLHPAPQADRRALIRRATFDLTGLPPTPDEVRSFVADNSPDAFARVVERLLASPRYGERWGRHWLDVARYSDSNGLDENLVYLNAWRYRDYVVGAFNQDKPYDQFVQEQLAGDLLPRTADEEANYQRRTATGFLSLGAKMLAEDDPVKMEMDIVDEQVDTTARAFMGLTVGCARCHDHKFDPIPTADYYSLAGIFRSTKTMENFKVVAKWHEHVLAPDADREKLREHEERIESVKKEIESRTKPAKEKLQEEGRRQAGAYLTAAADLMELEDISPAHVDPATGSGALVFDNHFVHEREFSFTAPSAGLYQLELHYGSAESRPVALYLNGVLVKSKAVAGATGSAVPEKWSVEGVFAVEAGNNSIRVERPGKFPEIDKLQLAPWKQGMGRLPKTAEQLAAELHLNPEFLEQWSEFLRRSRGDASSVMREWHAAAKTARPAMAARYQTLFDEADRAKEPDAAQKLLREVLYDKFGPFASPKNPIRYYPADLAREVKRLESELKELENSTPQYPRAMGVSEGKIANLRIHLRGNYLNLGEEVPRRFLRAIDGDQRTPVGPEHSGRLEFARWLTAPGHPLTSRVMVNRIWRWHFGAGVVPSVDNFGRLGEPPTNQPLLDWLSRCFVSSGWSIKQMHRTIMLSSAYQMSTAYDAGAYNADPENRLLWRMNRRRLEAEEIRDSIIAMSGNLDVSMGGTLLKFKEREYVTSTENRDTTDYDMNRRSVYLPVIRSSLYDVFQAFDFGDPSVLNGDRPATTVAPQALFVLNSSLVLKNSRKMAEMLMESTVDPQARVSLAYERAFGRPPSAQETGRALDFVRHMESTLETRVPDTAERRVRAWQSLCRALIASNEFIFLE